MIISKILVLSFEENEKEVLDSLMIFLQNRNVLFNAPDYYDVQNNLIFQRMRIDIVCRKVFQDKIEVELTYTEFEIFYLLARSSGRVFSKEQIYEMIWKESCCGDCSIIMSHVQNIRKKIEDEPGKPLYIQTVWGISVQSTNEQ